MVQYSKLVKYLSFVRIVCLCVLSYVQVLVFPFKRVCFNVCFCYNTYIHTYIHTYIYIYIYIYGLVFGLLTLKMKALRFSETSAHTQPPTQSLQIIYSLLTKEFFRLSVFHLPPCCLIVALSSFLHSSQYHCVFNIFVCFSDGCREAR